MKNRLKLVLALGAMCSLWASAALADFNVLDHGTWYGNGSTNLKVDVFGNLTTVDSDRDRDFSTFINLFSSAPLGVNGTYQMNSPKYVGQFSRVALMFNYVGAAASDSDSVAFVVRVYGRTSLTSGNRYLWTPLTSTRSSADTCFCNKTAADSAGAAGYCITPPPSFVVGRTALPTFLVGGGKVNMGLFGSGGTSTTRGTLRKVPAYAWRQGGSNGIILPLSDDAGNPCPFPYIEVEVQNMSFSRALTVSCDAWPRVN